MNSPKLVISSRKYKGESTVFSVRLPIEMVKTIDQVANDTGRNRNEIVTLCLEYAIDNLSIESNDITSSN